MGRDAELARLRAVLAEAIGGQGRMAATVGDGALARRDW
jgi:hypothetical protein